MVSDILPRVQANDLWVADRNFCTSRDLARPTPHRGGRLSRNFRRYADVSFALIFIVGAVLFLAYSNGANDNFKGVAALEVAVVLSRNPEVDGDDAQIADAGAGSL